MTRVERLCAAMGLSEQQAVVLYKPANLFYLTGYRGEGLALVGPKVKAIVTDSRYTEQAGIESPDFEVCTIQKGQTHEEIVAKLCAREKLEAIFFEADTLTVQTFEHAKDVVKGVEWKALSGEIEHLREVKDEGELTLIEQACKITGEAFERILSEIHEGMTEKDIAIKLDFDMLSHGAEGMAFSTIVAAGAHGSLPHAVPGEYRIRRGDMITMDFGARVGGYCADMTRTVALGQPSDEMRRVYETVQMAQQLSQDAVKAGGDCHAIDAIARDYIDAQGYKGRFGHGLGHSLGVEIHESPRLSMTSSATLKVGQLMTVEPGVYLPGVGGVRIENTVVVLEDGCRALTVPTRELIIL